MPDQFQDCSYLAYPSPSGSAESPAASNDASGGVNLGINGWMQDPGLDALYDMDWDNLPELTEEDLELIASIPPEDLALLESQDPAVQPSLLQAFPYAQNVHAPPVIPTPPWTRAQSDPPKPPRTPCLTQPAQQQLLSPSQPRQHTRLPPLAPVTPTLPPTPPHSGHPRPQPSTSTAATSVNPYVRTPWPPVPPPGERERLALPAPGDLNYSACEVIM